MGSTMMRILFYETRATGCLPLGHNSLGAMVAFTSQYEGITAY